jgi:hypothetical protein
VPAGRAGSGGPPGQRESAGRLPALREWFAALGQWFAALGQWFAALREWFAALGQWFAAVGKAVAVSSERLMARPALWQVFVGLSGIVAGRAALGEWSPALRQ